MINMNIFTFNSEQVNYWQTENDVVMGGKSNSHIKHTSQDADDYLNFSGNVSLENNGGFAQIIYKHDQALDLSEFDAVTITGKGDGKTYKLRFDTEAKGVAYQAEFSADADFETTIKFSDLEKVHHGEKMPDKPNFDSANIESIGILIGNGTAEEFKISLGNITALKV